MQFVVCSIVLYLSEHFMIHADRCNITNMCAVTRSFIYLKGNCIWGWISSQVALLHETQFFSFLWAELKNLCVKVSVLCLCISLHMTWSINERSFKVTLIWLWNFLLNFIHCTREICTVVCNISGSHFTLLPFRGNMYFF